MQRVTREIVIDAPVPTIWRHLADPARRRGWFGGELDVELTPGREGTFVTPRGTRPVRVDDVDQGRSVTFTWGEDDAASRVTIELEPAGDASRVRVTETTDSDVRHGPTDMPDDTDDADRVDGSGPMGTQADRSATQPADPGNGADTSSDDTGGDDTGGEPVASVTSIAGHVRWREVGPPADLPELEPAREATPLVTSPWARAA